MISLKQEIWKVLTMDDLIENLQTCELNRQQGSTVKEGTKEK